ncbi:hypothetical protein E4198_07685 [Streptomyces sp. RKND-216]|uniref:hypothetical protein n=1 Tax=Streptomyces sp. RKND-216 TaxID=2562581 RepID=UPI00109D8418|nr:hypothetical protein [Streptomyces sp. RKND-216]THA24641.1 hypothetical protein E4198_07685 [Streptomyces sp. RKND-216]
MSVDPTDPETFDDAYEEEPEGAELEAPEADAAEQQADLLRQRSEPMTGRGSDEVDPADAAEQARVVEVNEDEYR